MQWCNAEQEMDIRQWVQLQGERLTSQEMDIRQWVQLQGE